MNTSLNVKQVETFYCADLFPQALVLSCVESYFKGPVCTDGTVSRINVILCPLLSANTLDIGKQTENQEGHIAVCQLH